MYEESYFDPAAESVAGTQGLIQLLPATAEAMGVADPFEPESAIRGGVKYLRHLWDRFGDDIPPRERTWFALAAYNVGYHRGDRARQQAPASASKRRRRDSILCDGSATSKTPSARCLSTPGGILAVVAAGKR